MPHADRHVISILLQNESGALARVATMFATRGFNIESLVVAPTQDESVSRMTLVTSGDDRTLAQMSKQLKKLIDVVALADRTTVDHIERELGLFKFEVEEQGSRAMERHVEESGARILDPDPAHLTVEMAGSEEALDRFLEEIPERVRLVSVVRSGLLVISRGPHSLTDG